MGKQDFVKHYWVEIVNKAGWNLACDSKACIKTMLRQSWQDAKDE